MGPQPLDSILKASGLNNDDLVRVSTRQLTFKQVQKARTGRAVTANIQTKVLVAINACGELQYQMKDLFTY